jgi:arylmalonate decarboxylase
MTDPDPHRPKIGLIVPPAGGGAPPECVTLYGDAADFLVVDAGLKQLDLNAYSEAEKRLPALAAELKAAGADAIILMGTSLSFHKGRRHARRLEQVMADASGLPATSMSAAIIGALMAVGAQRVALATAYIAEVNDALVAYLSEHGVAATALRALNIHDVPSVHGVDEDQLVRLGLEAYRADERADGVFISCGGLQTLGVTRRLEDEIGKPVISSAVAGAWAAASIGGLDPRRAGFGQLLQNCPGLQADLMVSPERGQGVQSA